MAALAEKEKVLANKKRTYQMFAGNHDDRISEDADILKMKLQSKIKSQSYDTIGEIPGVSKLDESKRRRILKDLGVFTAPPTATKTSEEAKQAQLEGANGDEENKVDEVKDEGPQMSI